MMAEHNVHPLKCFCPTALRLLQSGKKENKINVKKCCLFYLHFLYNAVR